MSTVTQTLRSVEWLHAQCAWYRHRAGESPVDAPLYSLCESALNDLAIACERSGSETARELVARVPYYADIDLDRVAIPAFRHTSLADVLDCEAEYYLDLGTDIATLAAWAILWHSEGVEYHAARSVAEYLRADEAETAYVNATEDVFAASEYASLEYPLW